MQWRHTSYPLMAASREVSQVLLVGDMLEVMLHEAARRAWSGHGRYRRSEAMVRAARFHLADLDRLSRFREDQSAAHFAKKTASAHENQFVERLRDRWPQLARPVRSGASPFFAMVPFG